MEDHSYFNHLLDQRDKQKLIAEYNKGRDDERDAILKWFLQSVAWGRNHPREFIDDIKEGLHRNE